MTGFIPQSEALAEARVESLAELLSMNPEDGRFIAGLPRIVELLRSQRARFAETEGKGKAKKGPVQSMVEVTGELGF